MAILQTTEETMMHKLGPLPVWGWAAMAGGAVLIYRVIKSNKAGASTALGTAGSTVSGGTTGSSGGTGSTVDTGGTGSTGSGSSPVPGISATDLAGGSVLDFVKALGANYNSFSYASGGSSVGVSNSAQNILDAQNFQAGLVNAYQLATVQAMQNENTSNNNLAAYQAYLKAGGSPYFSAPSINGGNYRPTGGGVSAIGGGNPIPNWR